MARTLYVSFPDGEHAERAAGALLDYGVQRDDVSVVVEYQGEDGRPGDAKALDRSAKDGLSVTTPEDAGAGAAAGAGAGLGLGVLAGLASLFVPGIGLVYGGGALAAAIAAAVGTTAAGAVAGGVTGYLKDQGMPEHAASSYVGDLKSGKAILELIVPSGKVDELTGREIIEKYGGTNVNVY